MNGKLLGVDYGDVRTGLAVSDPSGLIATGIGTIRPGGMRHTAVAVAEAARERACAGIVIGLPKNMDGTEGPRAALYREMAATIQVACGMEVVLWDERRTTVEAHQILSDCNYHGKKRKNTVDAVAASLILEGYLAFLSRC